MNNRSGWWTAFYSICSGDQLQVFKKIGGVAVRLLLFPGIVEALVSGAVGMVVFKMPLLLAFAMGFILKVCLSLHACPSNSLSSAS